MQYDEKDRKLLDLMQTSFPLTLTPFAALASAMDITQEEVLSRVERLMEDGVLRRLGAVIDSKALGFSSCLLAMQVPKERMEEVAKTISNCAGVTHNYERDDDFNLWFTLTSESEAARDRQIAEWEEAFRLPVYVFPREKTYKRRVQFRMQDKEMGT